MLLGLRRPNPPARRSEASPSRSKSRDIQPNEAYGAQTQELEAALKAEGYALKVAPDALSERATGGDAQGRPDEGAGTRDSFAVAQRIAAVSLVA